MAYILCVDDEESISSLERQILKMAGHEVAVATNGFIALDMIGTREPDLVVLDRSMPGMDGIEVCRKLKANPFLSRVPVLMLTALAAIDFKAEGFDAGADDYLTKPFEPRELQMRVASLLRLFAREGDRNPTSGLPGGQAIAREVEKRLESAPEFALIYFDLDYFKPFADTFGFFAADRIIAQTGALLGELASQNNNFAGHFGGDDFILIGNEQGAEELAREAASRFRDVVVDAIGVECVERGFFTGLSRQGEPQEFPVTTLTAVIVPVARGNWVSLAHLGEAAATWKKAAKASGSGQILWAR